MQRSVKGEVITSTFDEQASRHVAVAENGHREGQAPCREQVRDVVILLDSITVSAAPTTRSSPPPAKILSGGVDANALHKPKRFFGAARNLEEGGSLRSLLPRWSKPGSRMDEVIFEEFKKVRRRFEIILPTARSPTKTRLPRRSTS